MVPAIHVNNITQKCGDKFWCTAGTSRLMKSSATLMTRLRTKGNAAVSQSNWQKSKARSSLSVFSSTAAAMPVSVK